MAFLPPSVNLKQGDYMDLADTLRVGDIIALSGSLVGFIASYARGQVLASQAREQMSELKVRVNEMDKLMESSALRVALNTDKTERHDKELKALTEKTDLIITKVLDKLEIVQKCVARIEGKIGLQ